MGNSKTVSSKSTKWIANKLTDPIALTLEIVSVNDATHIARCDGAKVAADPDEYAELNWPTYYILVNTWLFQVRESSERSSLDLHEAIVKLGLLDVVAACDSAASHLIAGYAGVQDDRTVPGYLVNLISAAKDDRTALQLLRYPKRFSPAGADLITTESIDGLIAINNRCKSFNRAGFNTHVTIKGNRVEAAPSRYWVDRIASRLDDMLNGYESVVTDGFFSSGVAADSDRPLADKLQAYAKWEPNLYHDPLYPIGTGEDAVVGHEFNSPLYSARVVAVPKSYKAARVIAEEHAYRQFHMQAIRIAVERCLRRNGYEDYLDLHSQIRNQRYANLGSRLGCYATIDLSSASDSVSRLLAYETLPKSLVSDVDKYLPRTFVAGKVTRTMHMFCTSGSAVTFPVESIIFLALALEVREVVSALTGDFFLPPCVFGDDIVVDTMLYDTTTDVLTQLGFVVNSAKSFGPGTMYRESCGCEYVCGYDLQSRYWPRATFRWDKNSLPGTIAQLCSLEHKLYANYMCKVFLVHVVRGLEPRMTSHEVGVDCVDLWEDIPVYKVTHAPGLRDCTDAGALRHRHLSLKTRRTDKSEKIGSAGFKNRAVLEMWYFARFLRFGRSFDDELLRLLGVSSKPSDVRSDSDTGEQYWGFVTE